MPSTWKAGLPISMEHVKSLTTREGSAPRLGAVRHRYRYTWQLPATTPASIVPARRLSSAYLRLNLFGIVIVTYCPRAHAHSYANRNANETIMITSRWGMEFEEDRSYVSDLFSSTCVYKVWLRNRNILWYLCIRINISHLRRVSSFFFFCW